MTIDTAEVEDISKKVSIKCGEIKDNITNIRTKNAELSWIGPDAEEYKAKSDAICNEMQKFTDESFMVFSEFLSRVAKAFESDVEERKSMIR